MPRLEAREREDENWTAVGKTIDARDRRYQGRGREGESRSVHAGQEQGR